MFRLMRFAVVLSLPMLAACAGGVSDLDFDFRPTPISDRANIATADRPVPDSRGLITYPTYQVAVARRGDTVADVAARIGIDAAELARFNGRSANDPLREDEILALPRRVTPSGGGTDIAAIARGAIDAAEASGTGTASVSGGAAPSTVVQSGAEPVRHQVDRGETAYSIARLYGVSVRSLAEWNGLGPDLTVREGQYLIIPIVIASNDGPAPSGAERPGASIAPLPPSAATPLPDPIEQATLPSASDDQPVATPAPAPEPASTARFVRPVDGPVIRPYSGSNEGIDIGAAEGTAVRAAAEGTVAAITESTDQIPILVLRHPDGLLTVYANIQNIRVARGDSISRGQTVAEVGAGDPSFLHFEVRRGFDAVDPGSFLP